MSLSYTLLADGSSDAVLIYVINWLLREHSIQIFEAQFANPTEVTRYGRTLPDRISRALELYPCDLLFVHRDAENVPHDERKRQILDAIVGVGNKPAVCLIPVRMTEAWLLFDEDAIRNAAGNPNGSVRLNLPAYSQIEGLTDPKEALKTLLVEASELTGRRLKKFNPHKQIHRVAELVDDFSPLRDLSAFQRLEEDLQAVINQQRWQ